VSVTELRERASGGDVQNCYGKAGTRLVLARILNHRLLKPAYPESIVAGFIITACLTSSAIWILSDRHVWWWDQAFYGEATLRLWQTRLSGIGAWVHANVHVGDVGGQQPLITWLGQFFIPLRHLTGDFESAILFLNVLTAGGTLILIYYIARHLGANRLSSLAGVLVGAGSGLFIGLTHQYLVEMTQCFTAALCVAAAWGAEKRSSVRTLALVLAVIALSFLAKSSSMTFVLPMLTYIAVALWITRRKVRPAFRWMDALFLVGAAVITVSAVAWYAVNWRAMVQHFVSATTADIALNWGSPVNLPVKLSYWTASFMKSLSPFAILSVCTVAIVVAALAISVVRLFRRPPGEWAEASIANGTLFAVAFGGTIVATILAFSLQINEDVRFLLPLIPITSVLVAWSLFVIRNRVVDLLVFLTLAMNAAVNHAYSHGLDPFRIASAPWLFKVDGNASDRAMLIEAVRSTCQREHVNRPNLIAVSYATLNANSFNFYAAKESYESGYRCSYTSYNSFDPDIQHALDTIKVVAPLYIVTVAPDKQPPPDWNAPDFVNGASRPLTEHLATDPHYRLVSGAGGYLLVYREVVQ
jgi:4-amino-4-deoxy-L-arabinose transferase-like glycosyltransferase